MQEKTRRAQRITLPVLPLRGIMVFPYMVMHFDVGRPKSVAALERAMMEDQRIFLIAQKDAEVEDPQGSDLYKVGTVAHIKQVLNLPGDSIRVLVEGLHRAVLGNVLETEPFMVAEVRNAQYPAGDPMELEALVRTTHSYFEKLAQVSKRVSQETLHSVLSVNDPEQLADIIAANVLTSLEDRQSILEKLKVTDRLETLCAILLRETELSDVEKETAASAITALKASGVKKTVMLTGDSKVVAEHVAKKLGVARQTYINIEKGLKELTLSQVRILEEELQVSFDDLLGVNEDNGQSVYRKYLK